MSESGNDVQAGEPGVPKVYGLFAQLRKRAGILKAQKKEGVRFNVRSADKLNDKIRPLCDELGLLIFPVEANGQAFVVEDGTLAAVNLRLRVLATEDGSYFDIAGFGLGADNQDKAGGKAGTYAWKAALVQALLAGGQDDADDTDTPIPGGVRKKTGKLTVDQVKEAVGAATNEAEFTAALKHAAKFSIEDQNKVREDFQTARKRLGLAPAKPATPAQA